MKLCEWCKVNPVPKGRKDYCSEKCYKEKNLLRAKQFQSGYKLGGTMNAKKRALLVEVTCLGPICRGEKTFLSIDKKYNRLCPACTSRLANAEVINGVNI